MKLVIASILASKGDSSYRYAAEKKLKTKIRNVTITGIKIPVVVLNLSTPQGN